MLTEINWEPETASKFNSIWSREQSRKRWRSAPTEQAEKMRHASSVKSYFQRGRWHVHVTSSLASHSKSPKGIAQSSVIYIDFQKVPVTSWLIQYVQKPIASKSVFKTLGRPFVYSCSALLRPRIAGTSLVCRVRWASWLSSAQTAPLPPWPVKTISPTSTIWIDITLTFNGQKLLFWWTTKHVSPKVGVKGRTQGVFLTTTMWGALLSYFFKVWLQGNAR